MVRLPAEYQEVEYLENSGTQFIATDYITSESIEVKCKYKFTASQVGENMLFGYSYNNNRLQAEFYNCSSWYCACYDKKYAGAGTIGITSSNFYNIHELILNNTSFSATGEVSVEPNQDIPIGSPKPMYIFAWNNANRYINRGLRIYYLRIVSEQTNQLVANFIPCYRKSDSEPGMYDTVSKTFYTNSGTGTFLVGNDVSWDTASLLERRRQIILGSSHYFENYTH